MEGLLSSEPTPSSLIVKKKIQFSFVTKHFSLRLFFVTNFVEIFFHHYFFVTKNGIVLFVKKIVLSNNNFCMSLL